ncbi:mitochondrial inner membrane protein OXA1, putative [Plasmodium sp. gorilla clade G2]|uniref:mitochondrial inner membrane protein OXA1, putative n=1 Tax=Plasmodium sp. gorilla clade G2 TaxID=880535 RepID=UPI000D2213F9|nr:mitochondrial inner membrane protein OXA1, putative [Plasmodium sp. gorilla clade G2]SOV13830.1 mitochondrial inner membrane protein OXA1, putative [Plasmodium sp. gorilla clade G2]
MFQHNNLLKCNFNIIFHNISFRTNKAEWKKGLSVNPNKRNQIENNKSNINDTYYHIYEYDKNMVVNKFIEMYINMWYIKNQRNKINKNIKDNINNIYKKNHIYNNTLNTKYVRNKQPFYNNNIHDKFGIVLFSRFFFTIPINNINNYFNKQHNDKKINDKFDMSYCEEGSNKDLPNNNDHLKREEVSGKKLTYTENNNNDNNHIYSDNIYSDNIYSDNIYNNHSKNIFLSEDESKGDITEDIFPYTDFIIEKCKLNIKSDVDIYENTWYVKLIYDLLNSTKIFFDCTWMSSIIMTTLFMRIIILPLTVSSERDRRKQKILSPLLKELTKKLKDNAQDGNIKKALEFKKKILNIRNTHGISLIPKSIILMAFFQTPLFFIFYFSMKRIASYPDIFKDFTFESPLWLDSLSLPDPYYILPLLSSLLLLSNNELTLLIDKKINENNKQSNLYDQEETEFQKNIKKITKLGMRLFYMSSVLFFKSMPSGLFIYFITNTFFQLFITQICKIKIIENFLDLPPLHSKGFITSANTTQQQTASQKKIIHMNDLIKRKK